MSMALPWMEGMAGAASGDADLPNRFCAVYWPFGVVATPSDADKKWGWFPEGSKKEYRFTNVLESMEPLRKEVTVIGGISHPNGWSMGGHDTGDIFLTGAKLDNGSFENTISLDQLVAERFGNSTRYASLIMSSDGGVGEPTRSMTLSFSREGRPLPALSSPRRIYNRLFGQETERDATTARRRLKNSASMLDRVLEHSRSLSRQLGKSDQEKLGAALQKLKQELQAEQDLHKLTKMKLMKKISEVTKFDVTLKHSNIRYILF